MGWAGRMLVGFWILLLIVHLEMGSYPKLWNFTMILLGAVTVVWLVLAAIAMSNRKPPPGPPPGADG